MVEKANMSDNARRKKLNDLCAFLDAGLITEQEFREQAEALAGPGLPVNVARAQMASVASMAADSARAAT